MNALKDPNLRNRLKKRSNTSPNNKPATDKAPLKSAEELEREHDANQEAEKQELFIELLGYMEAPNGNVEELMDKCKASTAICRGFVYTLIRRRWLRGYRVVDKVGGTGGKPLAPLTVWPGKEWMKATEVPDVTEAELKNKLSDKDDLLGIIARVHLYRFDNDIKKHVLDEVALLKTDRFPTRPPPFTDKEPPQDNSLENRKRWEDWNSRRLAYQQSDFPQFELIFQKLIATDQTVVSGFQQLEQTLDEMRRMGEALHQTFDGFSVRQLQKIVQSIPTRIKDVAKNLQKQTGIIIRDEGLKLTPDFLKNMNLSSAEEDGVRKEIVADHTSTPVPGPVIPNPKGSITMGGVPLDVLIPLLKKSYSTPTADEKGLRRLTM